MLSVMISIFYLPFRYCSLELQKIIVRFSHENVRGCIPLLKSLHRLLTDREFMIMLSALISISYLPIRYCSLIEIFYTFSTLRTPQPHFPPNQKMSRKTGNAQSRATFFSRHSAVLTFPAVLLRTVSSLENSSLLRMHRHNTPADTGAK